MSLIDDVKNLKAQGKTVEEIAEQLGIPYWLTQILYDLA